MKTYPAPSESPKMDDIKSIILPLIDTSLIYIPPMMIPNLPLSIDARVCSASNIFSSTTS